MSLLIKKISKDNWSDDNISGHDYLKFLTEELTAYMSEPHSIKKDRKMKRKQISSSDRWFGVLPLAIRTYLTKK